MRSSVDLPQPDGPTTHRNSPAAIVRSMVSSASTRPWPLMYSLRRPAILTAAPRRPAFIARSLHKIGGTLSHEMTRAEKPKHLSCVCIVVRPCDLARRDSLSPTELGFTRVRSLNYMAEVGNIRLRLGRGSRPQSRFALALSLMGQRQPGSVVAELASTHGPRHRLRGPSKRS